jgi:hypothetical protein
MIDATISAFSEATAMALAPSSAVQKIAFEISLIREERNIEIPLTWALRKSQPPRRIQSRMKDDEASTQIPFQLASQAPGCLTLPTRSWAHPGLD